MGTLAPGTKLTFTWSQSQFRLADDPYYPHLKFYNEEGREMAIVGAAETVVMEGRIYRTRWEQAPIGVEVVTKPWAHRTRCRPGKWRAARRGHRAPAGACLRH